MATCCASKRHRFSIVPDPGVLDCQTVSCAATFRRYCCQCILFTFIRPLPIIWPAHSAICISSLLHADGLPIQATVVRPAKSTGPCPALLWAHGGPHANTVAGFLVLVYTLVSFIFWRSSCCKKSWVFASCSAPCRAMRNSPHWYAGQLGASAWVWVAVVVRIRGRVEVCSPVAMPATRAGVPTKADSMPTVRWLTT